MFERFTERARQVVVLAQDEARAMRHNYIGTEHLLLGLLREQDGVAAQVLADMGIEIPGVQEQVKRIVGVGDPGEGRQGQIPFTPRCKKAMELSLREALSLGHQYIGTEHLLLALISESEGVAARILLDFDADATKLRQAIVAHLNEKPATGSPDLGDGAARTKRLDRARALNPSPSNEIERTRVNERHTAERDAYLAQIPSVDRYDRLAQVTVLKALRFAISMHNRYVGTEHLLLGLLSTPGRERQLLRNQGLGDESKVEDLVQDLLHNGQQEQSGRDESESLALSTTLARVFQTALALCLRDGRSQVGGFDLLSALVLTEPPGIAARILTDAGLDEDALREAMRADRPDVARMERGGKDDAENLSDEKAEFLMQERADAARRQLAAAQQLHATAEQGVEGLLSSPNEARELYMKLLPLVAATGNDELIDALRRLRDLGSC